MMQTRTPEHNERKCHMICKNPFVIKLGKIVAFPSVIYMSWLIPHVSIPISVWVRWQILPRGVRQTTSQVNVNAAADT